MTSNDVIFVNREGEFDTARYDRAPTPVILAAEKSDSEVVAIVKVLGRFEVLDLRTLTYNGTWTIAPPIVVLDDEDAAIAYAVLTVGRM